jgi:tRNA threonylcarbamoyladenosine biosynthesis protein TsaB
VRVLALDSSGAEGGIALRLGPGSTLGVSWPARAAALRSFGPEARALLARAGIRARDLEAVAVGVGPGSYTGIRIAASFAKTLALALERPLVAIPGLAAIAEDARHFGPSRVLVLETGHRQRVYGALYEFGPAGPQAAIPVGLYDPQALRAAAGSGVLEVGSASLRGAAPWPVAAATLALLAERQLRAGVEPADPRRLEPLYLQAAAPERSP